MLDVATHGSAPLWRRNPGCDARGGLHRVSLHPAKGITSGIKQGKDLKTMFD